MKEATLIQKFNTAQRERLQNNQMLGKAFQEIEQLQQIIPGLLEVLRNLPGYDKAIKKVAKIQEKREKEALAAEKEALKNPAPGKPPEGNVEEPKELILGK